MEGTPYAATFVLDHDDPVFTGSMLEEAARLLRQHLRALGPLEGKEAEGT